MRDVLQRQPVVRHAQFVMGTLVEITAYCPDRRENSTRAVVHEAMREFEYLERILSRFDPESELSRVNREAGTAAYPVSPIFQEGVEQGLHYSRLSCGSFSIAMEPLVGFWSSCKQHQRWPPDEKVNRARRLSDYRQIHVDAEHGAIRFELPGMGLNFDGFAKGMATDRARAVLQNGGISRALINAGSSSMAVYGFDDGEACRIGLRDPADESSVVALAAVRDASISSSGTGSQGYSLANRRISHLIDPQTGYPLEGIVSATVATDSAALAEVASKILLFRGHEASAEIFEASGWEVDGIRIESNDCAQSLRLEYEPSARMQIEILNDACSVLSE